MDKLLLGIFDAAHRLDEQIAREEPWADADKNSETHKQKIIDYSAQLLFIADSLKPFLPNTAEQIEKQFKLNKNILTIKKGANLFPRLS